MAILNGMDEPVPAAAPVPVATPVLRGRPHARGVPHPHHHAVHHGRGTPVPRIPSIPRPRGPPVGHVSVSAARSAAGLGPSSPTVAHAAPRAAAVPGDSYGVSYCFLCCCSILFQYYAVEFINQIESKWYYSHSAVFRIWQHVTTVKITEFENAV